MAIGTGTAILAGTIGSALIGKKSSKSAAQAQVESADRAAELQREMFNRQVELQEPFRQAGLTAQERYMQLMGLGGDKTSPEFGKYTRDFGTQDFQQDPGYAFRMSEGLKALDRQAAARGGLISGAALKGAQRYGQEAASQEYTNAFNRYQMNRANQLQPLQSLMGTSQTAANTLGQAAQGYAQGAGEAYMGAGNARASGYMGGANALAGAINQGLNMYGDQQLLNNMQMRRPSRGGNPFGGAFSSGAGSMGFGGGSVQGNSDYEYDL
jgi:hypothetical protein